MAMDDLMHVTREELEGEDWPPNHILLWMIIKFIPLIIMAYVYELCRKYPHRMGLLVGIVMLASVIAWDPLN